MNRNNLVYVCSPLSAPTREGIAENMEKAKAYTELVSRHFKCRAIAPHSFLPAYLDDNIPQEREIGLAFGLSVLKLSKAIVVCGDRISKGMQGEIRLARELNIPVYALVNPAGSIGLLRIIAKEKENEVQICKGNLSQQG